MKVKEKIRRSMGRKSKEILFRKASWIVVEKVGGRGNNAGEI
jgi:hypothetical protein